jgi:hypothetical protein
MRRWDLAAVVLSLALASVSASAAPDWVGALLAEPPAIPAGREQVAWLGELGKALEEAKRENRPVFVTLRCLPCKQCSAFDQDVLEGGAELTPLLKQFVTVRLTDANLIDLRILPVEGYQDLDLSWWGYFLSPRGQVYAIFGGKDHVSDMTRISEAALINTMKRVLAHHYNPSREKWDVDGAAPKLDSEPLRPRELPGHSSWIDKTHEEAKKQTCLHCHQINEVLRQPDLDEGKFDKQKDTQVWPLPENVGIVLDRDDGLLVESVLSGSPAQKAGMRSGDVLAAAGGRKLFGQADFRGALHRAPRGAGKIPLIWKRKGTLMTSVMNVQDDWRKTVLDWRMSISQGNIGADAGFFPLKASDNERKKAGVGSDAMAVKPFMYGSGSPATKAGLKGHYIITAVNGKSPNVHGRAFQWWFRQQFEEGDEVKLTVTDSGGKSKEIVYQAK